MRMIIPYLTLGLVALAAVSGLGGCKKDSGSSSGGGGSAYAGSWTLCHTVTAGTIPGSCPETLGVEECIPVTVNSAGDFSFQGGTGNVTSVGSFSVTLNDVDCGTGSGAGTCATTSSCTASFAQGGHSGTGRMYR